MVSGGLASRWGKPAAALNRRDAWNAGRTAFTHQERLHALHLYGRRRQKIDRKRCFGAARFMKSRYRWAWFRKHNAAARKDRTVSLPPDSPLRRRLLVLRLATTGFVAPASAALAQGRKSPAPAEPNLPGKNQPRPEQRRSGETDADPNDEPGNGRGVAGGGRSLEATDADPGDAPGRGRGGNGVTDADPGDQPGRGRGNAGASDADPGDPVGQGRRAPPPQLRTGLPAKKA